MLISPKKLVNIFCAHQTPPENLLLNKLVSININSRFFLFNSILLFFLAILKTKIQKQSHRSDTLSVWRKGSLKFDTFSTMRYAFLEKICPWKAQKEKMCTCLLNKAWIRLGLPAKLASWKKITDNIIKLSL